MTKRCPFTGSAADFLPTGRSLPNLEKAAATCHGCELYCHATQVVFGEGPKTAKLMLVGEQPGNDEDLQGRPFVGPAGKVIDRALKEIGYDRKQLYITNAVKHFKFILKGTLRQHRSPGMREIKACKPWLEAEIEAVAPQAILCLGGSAAKSLFGPGVTIKELRGNWSGTYLQTRTSATYHPSAILRARDDRAEKYEAFKDDLAKALKAVA